MKPPSYHPGLNRFATASALAALLLIALGGLVTSHEAGLAVPDWPTTFGYNMFLFPVSRWRGGVFFEHVHRLFASGVGLLTVGLAICLWRCDDRLWVRRLGGLAVLLVVAQGILGGLRVTQGSNQLGLVHATLAHLFLALMASLALFTSKTWLRATASNDALEQTPSSSTLAGAYFVLTLVILLQLLLAATMRHQHAGLMIPDFPTTFGRWWPDVSTTALAHYNQAQPPGISHPLITAFRVRLHLAHRAVALVILCGTAWAAWQTIRSLGAKHLLARLCSAWAGLVFLQFALGAATVWTGKNPAVATLHVVFGAVTLVLGNLTTLLSLRRLAPAPAWVPDPVSRGFPTPTLQRFL